MELGTPRLSWRRLAVLIRHMPRGSALHRELDPEGVHWDPVNSELLAAIVEAEHLSIWQRGGGKGPRPRPVRRPSPLGVRRVTWDERVRLYEEHKAARQRELEVMANGD